MDSLNVHDSDTLSFLGKSILGVGSNMENSSLWNDWAYTSMFLAVFVCILGALLLRYSIKKWVIQHLKILALLIWVAGVVLYRIGFDDSGCADNMLALYLRSSLSSMEMFVSHSDLIEVKQACHHSGLYMTVFSLVHFCAVVVSAVFILRLFGLNMLSWLKMAMWNFKSMFGCQQNLSVFFGVCRNSINMAKSLDGQNGKGSRILFVNMPDDSYKHEASRFTFSHFFHTANPGIDKYVDEIEETGAVLVSAGKKLRTSVVSVYSPDRLLKSLGLSRFCDSLVCRTLNKGARVDFYFLSDNEQDNLSAIMALKKMSEKNSSNPYVSGMFSCYCHARRNNVNFALLNSEGLRHRIHLMDSSSLSVLQLKKDVACQPVNFAAVQPGKGIVSAPFTAMVVGFGETGRDAFSFMYEFGTFISSVTTGSDGIDHVVAQKKKIYVVDTNLESLKSDFLSDRPGLRNDLSVEWCNNMSMHSGVFSDKLKSLIKDLNCIVVTVGDDEDAISIVEKICRMAFRYRKASSRLGVFVRIRHKEQKEKMMAVKDYFDRYNTDNNIFIHVFGCSEDIFSYKTLRHDILDTRAMAFYYRYSYVSAGISESGDKLEAERARLEASSPRKEWMSRRENKSNCSSIKGHINIYYKEEQDRSNAWHILTKRILAGLSGGDESARERCLNDERLIRTLSYCEHLRWNAKMYLMGFEYGSHKVIEKKLHPCLIDCDSLLRDPSNKDTLLYDEAVVKLSFSKDFDDNNDK